MDDPREVLLADLDIASCRVAFSISPIVLLCGGKVPEVLSAQTASFRHAITREDTSYEVFRPEEITNWQSDSIFKNLMDFEEDLASICSLVVIILESPGSIAELGAFSQLSELSEKLIVIKSNEFNDVESFINLGILRYIAKRNESSVKSYPWTTESPQLIQSDVVADAIKDIQNALSMLPKSAMFKQDAKSHMVVLICELIAHFVAVKEKELINYLERLGVKIERDRLRGTLFLLEKFRLIKKQQYSDSHFYMPGNDALNFHKIRLSSKTGKNIDHTRVYIDCIEYYKESEGDRHRSQVIKKSYVEKIT